jgi:hypothetical protein
MEKSDIITSNLVCNRVSKIQAAFASTLYPISTEKAIRIWWLSMHHKINQKGIIKQQSKHITKNEFGEAKTRWRSHQSEGLLRNAPND